MLLEHVGKTQVCWLHRHEVPVSYLLVYDSQLTVVGRDSMQHIERVGHWELKKIVQSDEHKPCKVERAVEKQAACQDSLGWHQRTETKVEDSSVPWDVGRVQGQ